MRDDYSLEDDLMNVLIKKSIEGIGDFSVKFESPIGLLIYNPASIYLEENPYISTQRDLHEHLNDKLTIKVQEQREIKKESQRLVDVTKTLESNMGKTGKTIFLNGIKFLILPFMIKRGYFGLKNLLKEVESESQEVLNQSQAMRLHVDFGYQIIDQVGRKIKSEGRRVTSIEEWFEMQGQISSKCSELETLSKQTLENNQAMTKAFYPRG